MPGGFDKVDPLIRGDVVVSKGTMRSLPEPAADSSVAGRSLGGRIAQFPMLGHSKRDRSRKLGRFRGRALAFAVLVSTAAPVASDATAVAAPATATLVRNLRRSTSGLRAIVLSLKPM